MKPTRRKFLQWSFWGSLVTIGGWQAGKVAKKMADGKTVRMITADGKVVELPESCLPQKEKKRPVSNEELKEWMGSKKELL